MNPISLLLLSVIASQFSPLAQAKETAAVLPKSIKRVRVVGVATDAVRESFNDRGELQSVTNSLNRSVTISDFSAANAQLGQLVAALNGLEAGLGDQLLNSNLYSDMRLNAQIYMPALEYGITETVSIGARIPVVKRSVRHKFSANTINNAQAISNYIGGINPAITDGLVSVGGSSFDAAFFQNSLFASKGYQGPKDFEKTQIGDLEFGVKYNFYNSDTLTSTALMGMRLPTGAQPALDNIFDQGTSKGATAVCLQGLQDVKLTRSTSLLGTAKAIYNFPDTRQRAVPRNAADSLPSLLAKDGQVQDVRRVRGAELETEFSATQKIGESFELWGAYQYVAKAQDKFSGPGELFYDGLSKNTESHLGSGELGVQYSTIPAFRKKSFSVPMEVSLLYNRPLNGKNTPFNAYTRMDLMLYF